MAVLFKHACLLASLGGNAMWKWARKESVCFFWGEICIWKFSCLKLPLSPPLLLELWGPVLMQQHWVARARRRRWQLGVEGGVTLTLSGGSPPAVPIWGEKRPRGSSISSRGGLVYVWLMAAAEQKHTLPLLQHHQTSTLNYFSGKEVCGQWTQPLNHWFILYLHKFLLVLS